MNKLILVTGATGYIASRLIPRLLDCGYRVRALARDPHRLQARSWFNQIEIIRADVTTPSTLAHACDGVDTAYYLIHNMSHGHGYTSLELDGARNFAEAAETAGINHIIYLGGLADPEGHIAPHMRSRIETGKVLREGKVPVTEFRAGVIAGSGSISFEMIRFMTELFPIIPAPSWMHNRSQPIAIQNIIDYLIAALENKNGQGQVFEIGGPEIATYKDLMLRYAQLRGLQRNMLILPYIPVRFMAFGVGLMTPVPRPIAYALIAGLSTDSLVKHPEALKIFPEVKLIDFDTATEDALEKTNPTYIERVWEGGKHKATSIKHEGCFIDQRVTGIVSSSNEVIQAIENISGKHNWLIEVKEKNSRILIRNFDQRYGNQWIDWRLDNKHLSQTVFFAPRGLPGFLYWLLLYPFHIISFRGLIRGIAKQNI